MEKRRFIVFAALRIVVKSTRLHGGTIEGWQGICHTRSSKSHHEQNPASDPLHHEPHSESPFNRFSLIPARLQRRVRSLGHLIFIVVLMFHPSADAVVSEESAWFETRTEDFTVISDLAEPDLSTLLRHLARLDEIAQPYLPGTGAPGKSKLKLIIFSSRRDFRRDLNAWRFAGFMQPALGTNRLLIGPDRNGVLETAQHEYVHYLLRSRLDISLPIWFDEGLASLLGAVEFLEHSAVIGKLPERRMSNLFTQTASSRMLPMTLRQVLETEDISDLPKERLMLFYDWAWLLVHYLYFNDEASDPDIQSALASYLFKREGTLPDYLGTSNRSLERRLQRHLRSDRTTTIESMNDPHSDPTLSIKPLTELERDYELSLATLMQNPQGALDRLSPHLIEQPNNVAFLTAQSRAYAALDDPDSALEIAEHAYAISGQRSSDAMVNLADRLVTDCLLTRSEHCYSAWQQSVPLYRAALRMDPERIDAVFGLGLSYLYSGQPGDAVNYLKIAYQRMPWASIVNFYLGESYRQIGDTRASIYLINARNWAPDRLWRNLAEAALESIEIPAGSEG